jgi:hypothetical protein
VGPLGVERSICLPAFIGADHTVADAIARGRALTLPTFLVIGAMKAGTTSLHAYLSSHPQVFMAEPKELHYFVESKNWPRGQSWYEAHFAGGGAALARGEASPSYSQADLFPGAAERIAAALPGVRLVYLVRHPIARMRSMYLHQLASGRETEPIVSAFAAHPYYLNASRYAWQLDHYLAHFPSGSIKVVTTEALRDQPHATLASVLAFLGVDPDRLPLTTVRHGETENKRVATPARARLSHLRAYQAATRVVPAGLRRLAWRVTSRPVDKSVADLPAAFEAELIEQLVPDIARLRRFLGHEFDGWGLLSRDC